MGWLFLYSGIVKVMDKAWSAENYIKGAKILPQLFNFLLDPAVLPYVNLVNKWGLVAIGLSLVIGLFVRWSAIAGAILMMLYYLPVLQFPYVGNNFFIVDEHIIYTLVLLFLAIVSAGQVWGFDRRLN
jgi:thiosulfate dehydrogenase [quinone] large subunit